MPSKFSKIFLPFLFCLPVSVAAEIPILGFIGAYSADHRLEDYRAMRDAGFDVSVDGYDSIGEITLSLNRARQVGIKLMVAGRQIMDFPAETAEAIRNHPALFGYMLGDEPRMEIGRAHV